jgi:Carbohydrate-binding family 9
MKKYKTVIAVFTSFFIWQSVIAQTTGSLTVKKTADFAINGSGTAVNWNSTNWIPLNQRNSKLLRDNQWEIVTERDKDRDPLYKTSFKILYSDKGLYCLFSCEDSLITATITEDYANIYDEDVVEAFLWPDVALPLYFEYELSPHNVELPILIVNNKNKIMGWKPWMYEGERKTVHAIHIDENKTKQNRISWSAEFFIPFALLVPLGQVPPTSGTSWRANFYRIDYDIKPVYTSWQLTRRNFHDKDQFGTIRFE